MTVRIYTEPQQRNELHAEACAAKIPLTEAPALYRLKLG
jgi:hypothetical protein